MKVNISELRSIVRDMVLQEAKKKGKAKKDKPGTEVQPKGYTKCDAHDLSKPIENSTYKQQGAANWGPYTMGPGTNPDVIPEGSSWRPFLQESKPDVGKMTIWEAASHWFDHQKLGLGRQTSEGIAEKKIGFTKLKNKLAHRKGVTDPAGLAASIGRKKLGKTEFQKRAAAGRRK